MQLSMKALALLLAVTAALSGGCAPAKKIDTTTAATTAAAETTTAAEETTTTTVTTTAAVPAASILDGKIPLEDSEVFLEIQNETINRGLQQNLAAFGHDLLLSGSVAGEDGAPVSRLIRLSGEDGRVLAQTDLAGLDVPETQVRGDEIAVVDIVSSTVVFLDADLQETGRIVTGAESCSHHLSPSADSIYALTAQEGIRKIDRTTGEYTVVFEGADLYPSSANGATVTFSYVDRATQKSRYGQLDMESGLVKTLDFEGSYFTAECCDGLWLAGRMGEDGVYALGSTHPKSFALPDGNAIVSLLAEPARILTSAYDDTGCITLTLYGTDGTFLSRGRLPIPGGFLMQEPLWMAEGGYLFPVTDETGHDRLIFWDLSVPVEGSDLTLRAVEGYTAPEGTAVDEALYDRARALGEAHGVTILIADQCGGEYGDHAAVAACDEEAIADALDIVERVLSNYPDDFFSQLLCGNLDRVELLLTGAIRRTDQDGSESGFTSFDGFAQIEETVERIAVDITQPYSPENTLYHEIMHLTNHRLEFDARLREEAFYSEEGWNALNPEGFAYAERLTDLPENFDEGEWASFFVDAYSRTYAKEDRATIMEYAVTGDIYMFSSAPGRREKLSWLCQAIRDCFDTTAWPEVTKWEDTLNKAEEQAN